MHENSIHVYFMAPIFLFLRTINSVMNHNLCFILFMINIFMVRIDFSTPSDLKEKIKYIMLKRKCYDYHQHKVLSNVAFDHHVNCQCD